MSVTPGLSTGWACTGCGGAKMCGTCPSRWTRIHPGRTCDTNGREVGGSAVRGREVTAGAAEREEVGVLVLPRPLGGEQVGEPLHPRRVDRGTSRCRQVPFGLVASADPLGQRGTEGRTALCISHGPTVLPRVCGRANRTPLVTRPPASAAPSSGRRRRRGDAARHDGGGPQPGRCRAGASTCRRAPRRRSGPPGGGPLLDSCPVREAGRTSPEVPCPPAGRRTPPAASPVCPGRRTRGPRSGARTRPARHPRGR